MVCQSTPDVRLEQKALVKWFAAVACTVGYKGECVGSLVLVRTGPSRLSHVEPEHHRCLFIWVLKVVPGGPPVSQVPWVLPGGPAVVSWLPGMRGITVL